MNPEIINIIKQELIQSTPQISITQSFQNLINEKVKNIVHQNLYQEKSSIRLSFEKILLLEYNDKLEKQKILQLNKKHIGDVIFILPSFFKGGNLSIIIPNISNETFHFSLKDDIKMNWICYTPGIEFEISKIESGNCILLFYKVYNEGLKIINPPKIELIFETKNLLNEIFDSKNNKIGFVLENKYDYYQEKKLTGNDLFIFHLIKSMDDFKVKIEEFKVKNSKHIWEGCNCEKCKVNGRNGRNGEIHYSILLKSFPIMNLHQINWIKVTEGKEIESQQFDRIKECVFKHGMIEIMKRKRRRNNEFSDDDEDMEIKIVGIKEKSLKCPISKCRMDEPVKCKTCEHSYDKSSILSYLEGKSKVCPLSGCNKQVTIDVLENDLELIEMIKNAPESEDEEEMDEKKNQKTSTQTIRTINSNSVELIVIE